MSSGMEYREVATYWTIRLRKRSIKNFFGRRGRRKPAWPERGAQGKKLGQRESPPANPWCPQSRKCRNRSLFGDLGVVGEKTGVSLDHLFES
jgi:hypothetical protein